MVEKEGAAIEKERRGTKEWGEEIERGEMDKKNGGGGQFVPVFALRKSISQPLKKERGA